MKAERTDLVSEVVKHTSTQATAQELMEVSKKLAEIVQKSKIKTPFIKPKLK